MKAALSAGADPGTRDKGFSRTPLHYAAQFNANPAVITALIEAGADPDARDIVGETPFDHAENDAASKGTDACRPLNEGRFE